MKLIIPRHGHIATPAWDCYECGAHNDGPRVGIEHDGETAFCLCATCIARAWREIQSSIPIDKMFRIM